METIELSDGIRLYSGVMFDFNNPDACNVGIEDIARGLSKVCRFAGHIIHFYSVAQHAVNCSRIVDPAFAFDALMHDTAEAFTNALPRPLKTAIPAFKRLETKVEAAMSRRFGFAYPLPPQIVLADNQMLSLEKDELTTDVSHWTCLGGCEESARRVRHLVDLSSWTPDRAEQAFLARYEELRPC